MKKIIQVSIFSIFVCAATAFAVNPETHTMNVYWLPAGAPEIVWNSTEGVAETRNLGYLVGYAVALDRPYSEKKIFTATFTNYDTAVAYLLKLPNPTILPRPLIAN